MSPIRFTAALVRPPSPSVVDGLRAIDGPDPDFDAFVAEHAGYCDALAAAGMRVEVMEELDAFPDAVFVEDAALCVGSHATVLRPGAPSRAGEADAIVADLEARFATVARVEDGFVDGGDILVTATEVLVGLSARTDRVGVEALAVAVEPAGLPVRVVETPADVLHFKTDCAIIDDTTIFSTRRLAVSGCFDGYDVIECPDGEEAAANLIRVNDRVLMRTGFPKTEALLRAAGYEVVTVPADEAARIDGGLSCMSLRIAI
ncbi:MAG: arginine deiminase family protein [Actinomycetota bacterium]